LSERPLGRLDEECASVLMYVESEGIKAVVNVAVKVDDDLEWIEVF